MAMAISYRFEADLMPPATLMTVPSKVMVRPPVNM